MKESKIRSLLVQKFIKGGGEVVFAPNVFVYEWESDLLMLDQVNDITEFEIKSSKWDFLQDAKKVLKHRILTTSINADISPNFFYFVGEPHIVDLDNVPEYAGVYHVLKGKRPGQYFLKRVKDPQALHSDSFSFRKLKALAFKLFTKLES